MFTTISYSVSEHIPLHRTLSIYIKLKKSKENKHFYHPASP